MRPRWCPRTILGSVAFVSIQQKEVNSLRIYGISPYFETYFKPKALEIVECRERLGFTEPCHSEP